MEGWGINLLWRDIVRPAILVGKYRLYPRIPCLYRHGEYVKRTFPLYLEDDTNANPTGGICEIQYKLVDGEACRILKLVKYTIYNIVDEKVMK